MDKSRLDKVLKELEEFAGTEKVWLVDPDTGLAMDSCYIEKRSSNQLMEINQVDLLALARLADTEKLVSKPKEDPLEEHWISKLSARELLDVIKDMQEKQLGAVHEVLAEILDGTYVPDVGDTQVDEMVNASMYTNSLARALYEVSKSLLRRQEFYVENKGVN